MALFQSKGIPNSGVVAGRMAKIFTLRRMEDLHAQFEKENLSYFHAIEVYTLLGDVPRKSSTTVGRHHILSSLGIADESSSCGSPR